MKASYNWLKELVDLEGISPEEVARGLTSSGIEVEGYAPLSTARGLIIGEIKECEMHPDSDHLHVLKVYLGEKYGTSQIVCGAPNARAGIKVIVCLPGAELPGGKIQKGVIRGVASDGMCASLLELGIEKKYLSEEEAAGIEELSEDAPVGEEDVLGYLGLDDVSFDISVLPNRPDALHMLGLAHELSAIFHRNLKPVTSLAEGSFITKYKPASKTPKCRQFYLGEARGIKNRPSPNWMRGRLMASGIRSLNAVVDVGNYAMLLTGRPFNMYDASNMKGDTLSAKTGLDMSWKGMDGKEYAIRGEDIAIVDGKDIACLAGILTSEGYMCSFDTADVLLEVAHFDSVSIRKTSARLGLASDSSTRFVRGIDPTSAEFALKYAYRLLLDLAGAEEVSKIAVYDQIKEEPVKIITDVDYINARLGTALSEDEVVSILEADHMKLTRRQGKLHVVVPSYRLDIKEPCDICEEVIRLYGYDKIKGKFPIAMMGLGGLDKSKSRVKAVRDLLLDRGFYEAITYTLTDPKKIGLFDYLSEHEPFRLLNPLSPERSVVRRSILYSLIESAVYNANRQNSDFVLFENSDVDAKGLSGERLALVAYGKLHLQGELGSRPYDFYFAKGVFEAVLEVLGIGANRIRYDAIKDNREEFHPYRSQAAYLGKQRVAVFGEMHPSARESLGLKEATAIMEIDLKALVDCPVGIKKAVLPSRFPVLERDIAILLKDEVPYAKIKEAIRKASGLIKSVEVFDLYKGTGVPAGYKSMALRLRIYDENKTLTDAEGAEVLANVTKAIVLAGAEVRS